jgi:hypothetical protein
MNIQYKTEREFRMNPSGRKCFLCKVLGCSNIAQMDNICVLHGFKSNPCATDGCTNIALQKGKCIKHGAKSNHKRCQIEACSLQVIKAGYCTKHNPDYIPLGRLSRKAQVVMDYLLNIQLPFECEKRFPKCRNKLPLPFDFYIPIYNLCIEYDGEQHVKPVKLWGGEKGLKLTQKRDGIKNKFCKDNNINLLRIQHTTKIKDIPQLINKALHESCET